MAVELAAIDDDLAELGPQGGQVVIPEGEFGSAGSTVEEGEVMKTGTHIGPVKIDRLVGLGKAEQHLRPGGHGVVERVGPSVQTSRVGRPAEHILIERLDVGLVVQTIITVQKLRGGDKR